LDIFFRPSLPARLWQNHASCPLRAARLQHQTIDPAGQSRHIKINATGSVEPLDTGDLSACIDKRNRCRLLNTDAPDRQKTVPRK
jgi:hypothetical protein